MKTNVLYFGDNLKILRNREYFPDECVDLIYLDPPFSSSKDYNILYKEVSGKWSEAQIKAFTDTWHWTQTAQDTYHDIVINGPLKVGKLIGTLHDAIGGNDVMAYLVMMTARLIELHRVLKPTGSIYLHCDPTASHYLKLVLDQIFGLANFRNEIVWHYRTGNIAKKQFQRKHDVIFLYSKTQKATFHPIEIKEYYAQVYGPQFKPSFKGRKHGEDKYGAYRISFVDDVWNISAVFTLSKEHLEYPTQKPEALLERIIEASSNEGDVVLDPFCGCGTAVVAAQKLNRRWIGIDITHLAINLMRNRLMNSYGIKARVIGEPVDLAGARALARENRYQFQYWACGLIGARPLGEKRKGADKGIDGVIHFMDDPSGKVSRVVVQVKSGHVGVNAVRELKAVAANNAIGVLITLEPPTGPMKVEAVDAGYYHSQIWNKDYPKIQILTVEELLHGETVDMPPQTQTDVTFAKAPKVSKKEGEQLSME